LKSKRFGCSFCTCRMASVTSPSNAEPTYGHPAPLPPPGGNPQPFPSGVGVGVGTGVGVGDGVGVAVGMGAMLGVPATPAGSGAVDDSDA
jgi:hypothetical protein